MEFKNIVTKKLYKDRDGNEKAKWSVVGTLKTNNDGKQFIELFMFPGVDFYVFEQKQRDTQPAPAQESEEFFA